VVIGADTLVCLGDHVLGKPMDLADARAMLTMLSGREHTVLTGVHFEALAASRSVNWVTASRVQFRELTPAAINAYFGHCDPLDKAGAYAIQEHGEMVVAGFSGSHSNVVGLPMEEVLQRLPAFRGR
jgi:septum formation protein